jgi:hypothetical protein
MALQAHQLRFCDLAYWTLVYQGRLENTWNIALFVVQKDWSYLAGCTLGYTFLAIEED